MITAKRRIKKWNNATKKAPPQGRDLYDVAYASTGTK